VGLRISKLAYCLFALTLPSHGWADVLADSTTDFSSVQGLKNWYYGYYPLGNVNSFTQLPVYDSLRNYWNQVSCCPPWTIVGAFSSMHPNGTSTGGIQWAVREWISSYTGGVILSGNVHKTDTNPASTGVFAYIYVNRIQIWTQFIAGTDGVGLNYSLPVTLHSGDVVDFALAANGIESNDSTYFSTTIATQHSPVNVDFNISPTTVSASGFLHAVTSGTPVGYITPLQPKLWRIPANWSTYQLVRSFAPTIPIHLIVSDMIGYPDSNYFGNGAPWLDFAAFETRVRAIAAPFSLATNVYFDIWNEADDVLFQPSDGGYRQFWNGTIPQFYDTYFHAFHALAQQLGSSVRTAGPTFTHYDHNGIQAFLEFCLTNSCLVNSLTWHALNDSSDPGTMTTNIQDALTSFAQNPRYAPLGIARVDINEMIGDVFWHQPGGTLRYFSSIESSGAAGSARTCGFDAFTQCFNGTINGLLTANTFSPIGAWWAAKYYADGASARVEGTATNPSLAVFASNGSFGSQPPQILIGYADYQSSVNNLSSTASVQLNLANAGATTPAGSASSVGVRVELIPDTGTSALSQIQFLEDVTLPLQSGAGSLILPDLPLAGALRVTLLGTQTIAFAALANQPVGAAPFTINGTASSNLPVAFTPQTLSVCTVSGSTVTPVAAGTCTIQATQAGNATYAAATPVIQSFQVTPGSVVAVVAGSGQGATIGTPFAHLLQALLKDGAGNVVPNASVTFTAPSIGASGTFANGLATFLTSTNSFGVATSTTFTTNAAAGAYSVTAAVTGVTTSASFSLTNLNPPTLSITKTHGGNFPQGRQNATFTVIVLNAAGAAPTSGMVTVTETMPSGLMLLSMAGTSWTCPGTAANNCTRNDSLGAGASYPVITVTVNVSAAATSPQVNGVSVSGGGSATATITDSTTILSGLRFIPVTPCRVVDTRKTNLGVFGAPSIVGGTSRDVNIPLSGCSIPATAQAYSLNVAVVPPGPLGFLTLWPAGQTQPVASTLNSLDGRVKSNAAIVPAGSGGAISVFVSNTTDVVLDINGYFVPATDPTALAFYPITPCRIADTRKPVAPLAGPSLAGGQGRTFPVQSSTCNLPSTAQAYSLNFAAVPSGPLGFVTVWPTGPVRPTASTLNALTGAVTANAAIVAAGTNGSIDVFASNATDMVIDVNGYFAPMGTGGLSLYGVTPCRVLDTRSPVGSVPISTQDLAINSTGCGITATAQAFVLSATVVPPGPLGFLTLWPQGQTQPFVSTLNAVDAAITSNMAIVPTNNGLISIFASNLTHVVMDIFGYFGQ
jgi:xylan 1,4-beta-xylosidase